MEKTKKETPPIAIETLGSRYADKLDAIRKVVSDEKDYFKMVLALQQLAQDYANQIFNLEAELNRKDWELNALSESRDFWKESYQKTYQKMGTV